MPETEPSGGTFANLAADVLRIENEVVAEARKGIADLEAVISESAERVRQARHARPSVPAAETPAEAPAEPAAPAADETFSVASAPESAPVAETPASA